MVINSAFLCFLDISLGILDFITLINLTAGILALTGKVQKTLAKKAHMILNTFGAHPTQIHKYLISSEYTFCMVETTRAEFPLILLYEISDLIHNKQVYLYGGIAMKYILGYNKNTKDLDFQHEECLDFHKLKTELEQKLIKKDLKATISMNTISPKFRSFAIQGKNLNTKIDFNYLKDFKLPHNSSEVIFGNRLLKIKHYTKEVVMSSKICAFFTRSLKQVRKMYNSSNMTPEEILYNKRHGDLLDIAWFVNKGIKPYYPYIQYRNIPPNSVSNLINSITDLPKNETHFDVILSKFGIERTEFAEKTRE